MRTILIQTTAASSSLLQPRTTLRDGLLVSVSWVLEVQVCISTTPGFTVLGIKHSFMHARQAFYQLNYTLSPCFLFLLNLKYIGEQSTHRMGMDVRLLILDKTGSRTSVFKPEA